MAAKQPTVPKTIIPKSTDTQPGTDSVNLRRSSRTSQSSIQHTDTQATVQQPITVKTQPLRDNRGRFVTRTPKTTPTSTVTSQSTPKNDTPILTNTASKSATEANNSNAQQPDILQFSPPHSQQSPKTQTFLSPFLPGT